jgi:hypothetical protein
MKVIIAGCRHIHDLSAVVKAIADSGFKITEVVCGCARGIDRVGRGWAEEHGVSVKSFPPDKDKGIPGLLARNWDMAFYADALIAVWDGQSTGTKHMIDAARSRGLKVHVHYLLE